MSLHGDLLTWAKAAIVATGVVASTSVKIRKRPVRLKDDPDPLILVCPRDEESVAKNTIQQEFFRFPVLVVAVRQESQQFEPATLWMVDARATLRAALMKDKPEGLDAVHKCDYQASPVYSLDGYASGYDASGMMFLYHGYETIEG